ncbi:MAG: retropepsin-like aspartic protease [Pseudomonadota bacterium]
MSTRILKAFALALLCALQVASADTSSRWSIPLNIDQDRLTIEVEWVGETIEVTLDTAATYPLMDAGLFQRVNGEPLNETIDIFGVTGVRTYHVGQTGALSLGNKTYPNLNVAIASSLPDDAPKAIFPVSSLEGRTLDFQFSKSRLEVYNFAPREEKRAVRSRFSYQLIQGVPFIPVELNGVKGLALVDTGSDVTYINSAYASVAGATFLPEKTLEIFGTGPETSPVKIMRAERFDLGDHRKEKFEILSANTPVFDYVGRAERPSMVLGMDTLGALRLQIDREKQEIILSRRESAANGRRYHVSPMSGRIKRKR